MIVLLNPKPLCPSVRAETGKPKSLDGMCGEGGILPERCVLTQVRHEPGMTARNE